MDFKEIPIELFEPNEKLEAINSLKTMNQQWKNYNYNNNKDHPTIEQLTKIFNKIAETSLRNAAFCAFLFLTACRISEVVRYRSDDKTTHLPGIQRWQVIEKTINGNTYLQIKNRILKRLQDVVNPPIAENKLIPVSEQSPDYPLLVILDTYLDSKNWKDDEELFPMAYKAAYRIITRNTPWTPHNLRSFRCKMLCEYPFLFTPQALQLWVGWAEGSYEMAMKYSSSSQQTITNTFEKNIIFEDEKIFE